MKRYLPFVLIAVVALLTVGAGVALYRARQHPLPAANAVPASVGKSEERTPHTRGDPSAPVVLEEFGDFQCPSCSFASDVIHQLEQDYGSRLRVIFRQFPLKMHRHALEAAIAAEAAGAQGRFWEMHDLLYKNQAEWSNAENVQPLFESYVKSLGLDVERFKKDIPTREINSGVASDMELGLSRGVKNTPTVFINGHEIRPPFTRENFHEAIEAVIAANKKS